MKSARAVCIQQRPANLSLAAHPPTPALALIAVSLLFACGGENATGPDGTQNVPYDPCQESANLEKVTIADFESPPLATFTSSNDGTFGAMFTAGLAMEALEASKCSTDTAPGTAYHFVGTGFQSYGYSFGFNALNALPDAGGATYFDATEWDGFSMWVRKGPGPSASSIFASVADRFTEPSPAAAQLFPAEEAGALLPPSKCPDASMGGPCYCNFDPADVDDDGTDDPLLSQCDRFGAGVGISTEWRFFKVPFARMRQRAYGRPSMLTAPDARILGLEFGLDGENWDFWLDELAFYRDTEVRPQ